MKRIATALGLLLIMGTGKVSAANEACSRALSSCRNISKTLSARDSNQCARCQALCNQAKIVCAKGVPSKGATPQQLENITSASAHHLNCKQTCQKKGA